MITKIKTKENTLERDILLFKETDMLKRLVLLFGGNGVGKTTFLNGIKEKTLELETNKPLKIRMYTNSKNNISKVNVEIKDIELLQQIVLSKNMSEGQSIIFSFLGFLESVKNDCENNPDKTVVMILDEIDSGLSSENINMFCHLLNEALEDYKNLQIFLSSNNYHFVMIYESVFNMYNGKWDKINSYDEYYQKLANNMVYLGKKRDLKFLSKCDYDSFNKDISFVDIFK